MRFDAWSSAQRRIVAAFLVMLGALGVPAAVQLGAQGVPPGAPPPQDSRPAVRLTADEAVRMALENNLGIQAERLGPEVATFNVAQARAAYAPELTSTTTKSSATAPPNNFLTGSADIITDASTRTNVGMRQQVPWGGGRYNFTFDASKLTTNGFSNFNPRLGSNFNASYVQPLLRDFRIDPYRQQVLVSKKQAEIADLTLRQRVTATARAVRSAYFDLVGAMEGLKVAQQSLNLARESLRNNQTKVEVGTMAPIDIIEAQAEVSRNEESVIVQEGLIQSYEDRLRTLIMNPSQGDFWNMRIEPAEQPTLTPVAIDVEAAIANALATRTDLAQARKQLETTQINLQYAGNQKLPALDLVANYGLVGYAGTQIQYGDGFPPPILSQSQRSFSEALRDVFGNDFRTWSVQLQFSYPLGTSAAEAALAAGRVEQRQQNTSIRELEMQIATSVRDAARQVNTNLKRVEATRKAREFAEQRLEAEQKRMNVGLSTTFQLFQAQRDLATQRQNELRAVIEYNRALVDFEAVQAVPLGGR